MYARIRLKKREFEQKCRLLKLTTDDAKAKFLGCSPATMHRVLHGKRAPSAEFIAAVLHAFHDYEIGFDDLFETEVSDSDEQAS